MNCDVFYSKLVNYFEYTCTYYVNLSDWYNTCFKRIDLYTLLLNVILYYRVSFDASLNNKTIQNPIHSTIYSWPDSATTYVWEIKGWQVH